MLHFFESSLDDSFIGFLAHIAVTTLIRGQPILTHEWRFELELYQAEIAEILAATESTATN